MIQLSQEQARLVMLAAQGLLEPPERPALKTDILPVIRRMGALQIDTINVVARSPYLALFSRLGNYQSVWLDELLAEGALFEYWSHAACFLPIEDYPTYRRKMLTSGVSWHEAWDTEHPHVSAMVLARIRQEGALRSADFENPNHKGGTWWNWKEEKIALEHLFTTGELMVARREKFQRVYQLRERVLPDWDDAKTPTSDEVQRTLMLKAVRSLGIGNADWITWYFYLKRKSVDAQLPGLVASGDLLEVKIEGMELLAYAHPDQAGLLEAAAAGQLSASLTTLLSPFDPLVSDRSRILELFNFDYSLECYLPAPKRKYGYFCLPVLRRGSLVGRADAKAHRQAGRFEVKTLYLEPGVAFTGEVEADIQAALQRCADWHATPEVVIQKVVGLGD
jgi:uncharacterized protein